MNVLNKNPTERTQYLFLNNYLIFTDVTDYGLVTNDTPRVFTISFNKKKL